VTRRIVLARRPVGEPVAEDFRLEEAPLPELAEGEALVAVRTLSIDPAIRGFLDDRPSYLPPVAIGETVRSMVLGEVIRSRNPALAEGRLVRALGGWAEQVILCPDAIGLEPFDPASGTRIETYMGALGPAGLTAWVGLHEIGRIGPGDTVLVSAAAGAVGSIAGQIARLRGCRVIGLAGGAEKCAVLRRLGFDSAIDYRAVPDVAAAIREAAPEGVDVYFDNVGGETLEAMLPLMRLHGRIVVCGMIGDYNDQGSPTPVRTLWQMVVNRLTMRGFLTYDHPECLPQAKADLAGWVASGAIEPLEALYKGLEAAPAAFIDLMARRTTGKTLVRL
jgi:NADPH-dependent curcumin reductase CurA